MMAHVSKMPQTIWYYIVLVKGLGSCAVSSVEFGSMDSMSVVESQTQFWPQIVAICRALKSLKPCMLTPVPQAAYEQRLTGIRTS